uniref:IBB domain-containing protein n=1 Tax=Leersia perrieri TaxID=77586 RepID=A0A0D9V0J8_9ORYZ
MSLRPSERAEIRQKTHKPSVDAEVGRARRERIMVGIRKDERDRTLNEKRRLPASAAAIEKKVRFWGPRLPPVRFGDFSLFPDCFCALCASKLESLPILLQGLYSNDRSMQLEAAKQFRKQLSDEVKTSNVRLLPDIPVTSPDSPVKWFCSQQRYLVKQGCIKPLCDLLKHKDARIVSICVDSLDNILRVGEVKKMLGASNVNLFALMVEEAVGLNKIEDLQNHDNVDIYDKAFEVLESYLLEDDDQQPLQPPVGKSSLDESFFGNFYQGNCPPIDEVIRSGVVPRFVEFLTREEYPQLQAVWALGNVSGDSTKGRDLVLMHGAMLGLLQQFSEHTKLSMLRNAAWTLSNFCRGKPQPDFAHVKPALSVLRQLILSQDEKIIMD